MSEMESRIVHATLHEKPANATHWSTRTLAEHLGIGATTVRTAWRNNGLKPHLSRTFKVSRDPRFEDKLLDVVGLYLNPPEHALVLSCDEKSQIQALNRTQPVLPMKTGRAGTVTHDYKRHGTTTLFAALNTLDGQVSALGLALSEIKRYVQRVLGLDTGKASVHAACSLTASVSCT
jgi:hypothetical protein